MVRSEPARHALYARLEEILGNEHADTLMTHLPAHMTDEVATKADVDDLKERFDRLEVRFDRLEGAMRDQLRTYTVTVVGTMTALTGIFAAVVAIIQ